MLIAMIIVASALFIIATPVPLLRQSNHERVWPMSTLWDGNAIYGTTAICLISDEAIPTGNSAPTYFGHRHHRVQSASSSMAAQYSSFTGRTSLAVAPTRTTSPLPAYNTSQAATLSQSSLLAIGGGYHPRNGLTGAAAAGTKYTGDFTWYQTGLGACGITSTSNDHVVAVSHDLFDRYATANPNDNPICGKMVTLAGMDGNTYQAKIVDRCTGCAFPDLDLSEGFFDLVTNNGNGRVSGMYWVFD